MLRTVAIKLQFNKGKTMDEEVQHLKNLKDQKKEYQKTIDRGIEFPNGFNLNGEPETNIQVAKKRVISLSEEINDLENRGGFND